MDDLVAFLRAQLDEDEALARAATNGTGEWWWDHGYGDMCNDPTCPYGELTDRPGPEDTHGGTVLMDVHGYDIKEPWQGADHIARHDPARVLREVEAKQRIVDRYAWLREHGDTGGAAWVLPLLALPYADHPDYRPEWAPIA